jgi:SAM-dependent methyltransferase
VHQSQREHIRQCLQRHARQHKHYRVVDVGSAKSQTGHSTHRDLFDGMDHEYLGVDVREGQNVDVVMRQPYRIPLPTNSADIVLSGSAFEHIPFFWVTFLEICRITAPGGLVILTAPSRGNPHTGVDCWRFYPDAMRSLAAYGRMNLVEAHTDFPARREGSKRFDYATISAGQYWGDTVGVFRKPRHYSRLVRVTREVSVWWANRVGGVEDVPLPRPRRRLRARHQSTVGGLPPQPLPPPTR